MLTAEQKKTCSKCKHARAAHKGACRMKYCKCEAFHGG